LLTFCPAAGTPPPGIGPAASGNAMTRRNRMNKDQVKGSIKDAAGKVQEKVGQSTGDRDQESKGLGKQVEGKTQKTVGDVKDAVNNLRK
jgi:uncharacterized protein YjbJ (UPF0337 family)